MRYVQNPDPIFDAFVETVHAQLATGGTQPLFATNVDPDEIYALYLGNLPTQTRQYHTCNCCRRFIQHYGTLARIDEQGRVVSAMWPAQAQGLYAESVAFMGGCVEASRITGVFAVGSDVHQLGQDHEGGFTHLHVPTLNMRREREPGPWMALKIQDFDTLSRALVEYPVAIVAQAVALLEGDDLFRSEKVRGPARFLLDLHKALEGMVVQHQRHNKIWAALTHAPVGWATPRSGMIGTLLDDLVAGYSLDVVKAKFATKMGPLAYRRPTAPPKAGAVARAERLVAEMNLEPALARRFARIDDLELSWRARSTKALVPMKAGVFAGLVNDPASATKPIQMGFERFLGEVLPGASKLEFLSRLYLHMGALLTEAVPGSRRLFQWDNPVSHYTYPVAGGTPSKRWGLPSDGYVTVEAVTLAPYMWEGNRLPHYNRLAFLVVQGAHDHSPSGSIGLFPEFLRSDLHEVRSVIEAHSNRSRVQPIAPGTTAVGGLMVGRGALPNPLRVTTDSGVKLYQITGW